MPRPGKIDIDDFLDRGGTIAHDENAIGELDGFLDIVRDQEDCFLFALPDTDEIGRAFQPSPTAGSVQLHRMPAVSLDIGGDQLFRICLSLSLACEVKKIQNVATQAKEIFAAALARAIQSDADSAFNSAWPRTHDHNAVAHVDGFVDVVGNQEHGGAPSLPESEYFILHSHAREGVEGAKRLVQEEDLWMIDKRSRERGTLSHSAGKMVGISVGKYFESHQTHEFVHFLVLFTQNPTRDESGLDVAADGEPRKEIRILKNQTAFCAWQGDRVSAN